MLATALRRTLSSVTASQDITSTVTISCKLGITIKYTGTHAFQNATLLHPIPAPGQATQFFQSYEVVSVSAVWPSQYCTQPSRFIFFMTVLNRLELAASQSLFMFFALILVPDPEGYSMWNTGFPLVMKLEKVSHSSYSAHCSLTENCTTDWTESMMSPAFLRPVLRLRELASWARNWTKSVESESVRSRPLSFC